MATKVTKPSGKYALSLSPTRKSFFDPISRIHLMVPNRPFIYVDKVPETKAVAQAINSGSLIVKELKTKIEEEPEKAQVKTEIAPPELKAEEPKKVTKKKKQSKEE